MNNVQPGNGACERIRQQLNSYISNESTPESELEVLRHLEICSACRAESESRTRFRAQLKAAVARQYVPRDLQARVRQRIEHHESQSWWAAGWNRWAVAISAGLAICLGVWLNFPRVHMPALSDRSGQDVYIQSVSAALVPILRVGLRDHVHCSVFRKYPRNPPTITQMANELGPSYTELLELVKTAVPEQYRIIMAHQCGYAGRKYIHLTLLNGHDLVSLVITLKNTGESLNGLAPASISSGLPVFQSNAQRYAVAGFDAGPYLAFVVSDLRGKANLEIAAKLAPSVHEFLTKRPV